MSGDVLVRRRTMPAADEDIVTIREVGVEETNREEVLGGRVMRHSSGRITDWRGLMVMGCGDVTWSGVAGLGEGRMALATIGWKSAGWTKGADAGTER